MQYVIVDLEATCWEKGTSPDRMETIEIGAVFLESASGPASREFARFIKPVVEPNLSEFCQQLTTIQQEQVNSADYFWNVFPQFVEWIGPEPFILSSWGVYDLNQFRRDCERHKMQLPESFQRHINLKQDFAQILDVKKCGMSTALELLNLSLEGTHHRGIDDARNIARIAQVILPKLGLK